VGRNYGFMIPNCMNSLHDGSLDGSLVGTNEHRLVNLAMGEVFGIEDCFEGNTMVEQFSLGLQWDMMEGMVLDLDLGCVCLDAQLKLIDMCHFRQLESEDKAIVHGGDTLDDAIDKDDDEEINIDLGKINPLTDYIAFYVTSYEGKELNEVERCFAHFYVTETGRDIFTFVVDDGSDNSGASLVDVC
jgi:stress response protein SCP2